METMPDDVDIVITHSPPHGVGDSNFSKMKCGSLAVRNRILKVQPVLHVFGHIHEARGMYKV